MQLIDRELSGLLVSVPYSEGHGASRGNLGGSIIYYTLACLVGARVCVCLGSGGGFVPCLMRQAQRDMALEGAATYLVDAILPEAGFGGPEVSGGWRDPGGVFSRYYPEIITLICRTEEAGRKFFPKNRIVIDFLHVDADHSFEGALGDFETFLPLLSFSAFVTFHDTNTEILQQVLQRIAESHRDFQCLDMPDIGAGLAVLRRKCPLTC